MHGLKLYPQDGTDDYLATMIVQMEQMARKADYRFLSYLLSMAAQEAINITEGARPTETEPEMGGVEMLDILERMLGLAKQQKARANSGRHNAMIGKANDLLFGYQKRLAAQRARRRPGDGANGSASGAGGGS